MAEQVTYEIQPVKNTVINLDGWRIVRSDGSVLLPFPTRRAAEQLIEFFAPEQGAKPCEGCARGLYHTSCPNGKGEEQKQ